MEEELNVKNMSFIAIKDGETYQFENAQIKEIEIKEKNNINNLNNNLVPVINNKEIEFSIELKHMTKKKFIKLLMARKIAKNGAKDIANYFYKKYGYYSESFLILF